MSVSDSEYRHLKVASIEYTLVRLLSRLLQHTATHYNTLQHTHSTNSADSSKCTPGWSREGLQHLLGVTMRATSASCLKSFGLQIFHFSKIYRVSGYRRYSHSNQPTSEDTEYTLSVY